MLRQFKKEDGSITVEATISLSVFMFAIVTILSIINICTVQARMATAIHTTAKEISQYSYLYSLTGISDSQSKLYNAGLTDTDDLNTIMSDVNTVFNEIENLGKTGEVSADNVGDIVNQWEASINNIQGAGSSLEDTFKDIADDPKGLIFGIVKLSGSSGMDLVKSRLIAAPLAKVMCRKHLVSSKDGSPETYLKQLGVVPGPTGSYMDGLDFSQSSLFPNGSNEITINVSYDVKVIALLPIDFFFTFNQTAITHGWQAGEVSYNDNQEFVDNHNIWTDATPNERANLIRHLTIDAMEAEGYSKTAGLTDVQLYNKESNEFLMISSMNPLYSSSEEDVKTLQDIDDEAIQKAIEQLCGKMLSTTDGLNKVTTKTKVNGTTTKTEHNCAGATNKIVLNIPEDAGLKEKIESIIANADTNGVTIEVVPGFGNGAKATAAQGGTGE